MSKKHKIATIDEYARIIIEPLNFTLQYRRNSKKQISWRKAGYFPDLTSLAIEYINSSPERTENPTGSIKELVQVIKNAESRICETIINLQTYDDAKNRCISEKIGKSSN